MFTTQNFNEANVYISAMVKTLKSWKWSDILEYERSDVLGGITPPKLVSKISIHPGAINIFFFLVLTYRLVGYSALL
jgi:hypothetical protein